MAFSYLLVVCLVGLFGLIPLGFYLLWLSILNRRDHPTVVAGRWDFAAVLLGLSGFILVGGGLLLTLMQSNFRYWMRGNFEQVRAAWGQEHLAWSLIVIAYLAFVLGGIWLAMAARRRSLVVYHVEPAEFEGALTEVFEQLGRPVERRGNLWVGGVPLVEVESFEGGKSVTLRWVSDDARLFQDVDRQLRQAATGLAPAESQLGRWFMSGAAGCALLVVFCVAVLAAAFSLVR